MIKCQACGTQNLGSSQFCDECGDSLNKYKAPEVVRNKPEDPAQAQTENTEYDEPPVFQSANVTSVGIPFVEMQPAEEDGVEEVTRVGSLSKPENEGSIAGHGVHSNLVIERGEAIGTEFPLASEESNIGRWDADNGVFPDVDLDSHDPEAKVSRKHARIIYRNGTHMLEDLGSTNGTFVNRGRRLIPGNPQRIKEGDEIIVGKTFLRFHVINS
ncbi:MAG: FHA domain-containing protein [Pyrinomonadaceae bacterium]